MFIIKNKFNRLDQVGFTLIELVIIIVVLGILAAVAIPKFSDISDSSKVTATKKEMQNLQRAIVGNPSIIAGGQYIDRGFEGDVGFSPQQLVDLVTKPDSIPTYNRLTRIGWNGPYIESTDNSYLIDAWGNNYVYQRSSRAITAINGTDTLKINF
ncbi:MAG: prepilin-type N-terminal cleavage/methylation domain-containing protein [candidate division Zixibacteria bacterium]|nr:prepilin-type N-terminal cleavage/methylation domain-containing protein [candidate division Zixibacteria bacterium]